nr:hypothetical protein [Tanacetum cinerariifolium]
YNCPSKVSVISIPEPCNNQTIDELPQELPNFHPTFHSEAESPFTLDSTPTYVDESPNVFNPPPQPPRIEEEQAIKAQSWKFPVCYDDDDDEEGYNSLNDNIISELPSYSAVTHTKPIDSLSMGDEHLDTILATEYDEFIKSYVKNLVPNLKIVSDISNADIESFSPSPIHNEDSDPLMEEIDLFLNPDDSMLPGIEDDDDSERDSTILEKLLDNYFLSLPTNESYHFDIPSAYRPPAKPPDGNTGT